MTEIALASPMMPPKLAMLGGIEAHQEFLDEAGFSGGLELHPFRGSQLVRELNRDKNGARAEAIVGSAHQSYISTAEGMVPHDTLAELVVQAQALVVLPTAKRSLDRIAGYQLAHPGRPIPAVVYPEVGHDPRARGVQNPIFQPNVRVLKKWGVEKTDELLAKAADMGMTGIAWDGYHYLRTAEDGTQMDDWREALPQYLASTSMPIAEVHVSVGRADRTEDDALMQATRDEMDIFMNRPRDMRSTVTGKMLGIIHAAHEGNMRYVLEALPPKDVPRQEGLKKLAGNIATFLDTTNWAS